MKPNEEILYFITRCALVKLKQFTEDTLCDVFIVVILNNSASTTCSGKNKLSYITQSDT